MKNLEIELAIKAEQIAEKGVAHKDISDALGVLEEQGVYALFLFLKSKEKKGNSCAQLKEACCEYMKSLPYQQTYQPSNDQDGLGFTKSLADHLDDLLFARDMLCQCLIYARYHTKAKEDQKTERKAS